MIEFTKMHGIGNDYIYINCLKKSLKSLSKLAIAMSDRNFGIGSDGLILILPSKNADFKMRMFNSDGSEAEMCGNGIRCFAKYVYDHKLTNKKELHIETLAGVLELTLFIKKNKVESVLIDMGAPILERARIPMIGEPGTVIQEMLPLLDGSKFEITSLSMGNPHVVIFVEDVENFPVTKYGPQIERNDLFPHKTNVEFIEIINDNEFKQRTWERGSGETLGCGTGASAATVACILNERTKRKVTAHLTGGDLEIEWDENTEHVFLKGPAVEVFSGTWPM